MSSFFCIEDGKKCEYVCKLIVKMKDKIHESIKNDDKIRKSLKKFWI